MNYKELDHALLTYQNRPSVVIGRSQVSKFVTFCLRYERTPGPSVTLTRYKRKKFPWYGGRVVVELFIT